MATPQKPRRSSLRGAGAVVLTALPLAAACNVPGLLDRTQASPSPAAPAARASAAPVVAAPADQVQSLETLAAEYDRMQKDSEARNQEMADLLRRYRQRGGQLPPSFASDLTDEQRRALADRMQQERGTLRSLLQEILDKDRELTELRARAQEAQRTLPDFVEVKANDRHDRLVLEFLRNHGASELASRRLVAEINLQEPLLPGSRVWFHYQNGQFGTWVTQGRASMSPQEAEQRVRAALEAERDAAVAGSTRLRGEVDVLETRKRDLEREVVLLRQEADAFLSQMGELKREAAAARTGARYIAGSKKELEKAGVVGKSFLGPLRVKRLEGLDLLDVQPNSRITLDASAHGLSRIRKVTLLPDGLKRGVDYEVQLMEAGAFATVTLVSTQRFASSTFVVVVE